MDLNDTSASGGAFGVVGILAIFIGLMIAGYGVLLLLSSTSLLGGLWIVAIGLSLLLSGLFATEWAGDRLGLSAASRRLSLTFAVLAVFLLVAFVVVNYATATVHSSESAGAGRSSQETFRTLF